MLTKEQAQQLADPWVNAWNSHDLDTILDHYAEDVILVSPIAAVLLKRLPCAKFTHTISLPKLP